MKTNYLTFLLIPLILAVSCTENKQADNKEVVFSTWKLIDSEMKNLKHTSFYNYKEVYDSDGNLIEVINYLQDSIFSITKYTYENSIKKLMEQYDKSNKLIITVSYQYDTENRLTEELIENLRKGKSFRYKYYYDTLGLLTKKELLDNEDTGYESWKFSYKKDNEKKIETEEFYRDNDLAMVTTTVFNEKGLEVEKTKYYPDRDTATTYTYKYEMKSESDNDWTVKRLLLNDSLILEYRKDYQ